MTTWKAAGPEHQCHVCGSHRLPTTEWTLNIKREDIPRPARLCWTCYRASAAESVLLGFQDPPTRRDLLEATNLIVSLLAATGNIYLPGVDS